MDRMKPYETNQEFLDRLHEEDLERKHYEEQERRYREQLELRQYQEGLLSRQDWEYIDVVNIKYKGKGRNYLHERI